MRRTWLMPLAPVAPLLARLQKDHRVGREVALSMLLSQGRKYHINFGQEGWPYTGLVFANSRTSIRDLVDFFFPLGWRLEMLKRPFEKLEWRPR